MGLTQQYGGENAIFDGNGVWMYLDYDCGVFDIRGRLYTMGVRNRVCPAGWRMPTEAEWMELIEFIRGELQKRSGQIVTDAEVWASLRDGEFKAVMAGYMMEGTPTRASL
jgi:uncharacterized protein (TIGR02145 family)